MEPLQTRAAAKRREWHPRWTANHPRRPSVPSPNPWVGRSFWMEEPQTLRQDQRLSAMAWKGKTFLRCHVVQHGRQGHLWPDHLSRQWPWLDTTVPLGCHSAARFAAHGQPKHHCKCKLCAAHLAGLATVSWLGRQCSPRHAEPSSFSPRWLATGPNCGSKNPPSWARRTSWHRPWGAPRHRVLARYFAPPLWARGQPPANVCPLCHWHGAAACPALAFWPRRCWWRGLGSPLPVAGVLHYLPPITMDVDPAPPWVL